MKKFENILEFIKDLVIFILNLAGFYLSIGCFTVLLVLIIFVLSYFFIELPLSFLFDFSLSYFLDPLIYKLHQFAIGPHGNHFVLFALIFPAIIFLNKRGIYDLLKTFFYNPFSPYDSERWGDKLISYYRKNKKNRK